MVIRYAKSALRRRKLVRYLLFSLSFAIRYVSALNVTLGNGTGHGCQ